MKYVSKLPYSEKICTDLDFLIDRILEQITPVKIVLFGSYARSDYTSSSDYDLLVLTNEQIPQSIRGELCSEFEERNSDLVFYTEDIFNTSDCLLVKNIKKDGVILWQS